MNRHDFLFVCCTGICLEDQEKELVENRVLQAIKSQGAGEGMEVEGV